MELAGVVDATPLLEEGLNVLTVPLEAAEVRPEGGSLGPASH